MIDILIKSYNRPYYLDRCLHSIKKFVVDTNYKVVILDDGTPEIYLKQIIKKYPNSSIRKSEAHPIKSSAALLEKEPTTTQIPINLWIKEAQKASDYFLLLEDDIWFTHEINLTEVVKNMQQKNGMLTKLSWLGNEDLIQHKKSITKGNLRYLTPKLPFKSPLLFWLFFKIDRFKIHKTSKLLKIYTVKKKNSYYSIYSVAGVLFNKNYFLQLWNNHRNIVDEKLQILNALKFIQKSKSNLSFAHTQEEYVKTGFISSATNKGFIHKKCDMHQLNAALNKLWLNEQLDFLENFPQDFSINYIEHLLLPYKNYINTNQWKSWSQSFKSHFEKMGCNLD